MARVWGGYLTDTLSRGWESLCYGGGLLVEQTLRGLFWLDRSMTGELVEILGNAHTDMTQVVQSHVRVIEAITTGWNLLAGQLAHPFCTWLMVWGVLLPSAALIVSRMLFYGWKRYIGGKLFLAWCAKLPSKKSALAYVCSLSTVLLFVSQCLRWLFDLA